MSLIKEQVQVNSATFWSTQLKSWVIWFVALLVTLFLNSLLEDGSLSWLTFWDAVHAVLVVVGGSFWIAWGTTFARHNLLHRKYLCWLTPLPVHVVLIGITIVVAAAFDGPDYEFSKPIGGLLFFVFVTSIPSIAIGTQMETRFFRSRRKP